MPINKLIGSNKTIFAKGICVIVPLCSLCNFVVFSVAESFGFDLIDVPKKFKCFFFGERFFGGLGLAEYKKRDECIKLKTSNVEEIENAILLSTFPEIGTEKDRKAFERVSENAKLTRYGLDCYGYALVAMGTADLVIEAGLSIYDIQAPACAVSYTHLTLPTNREV